MLTSCLRQLTKTRVRCIVGENVRRTFASGSRSADEEKIVQENWEVRCQLATAYRALERYGISEGICNHLTAKAPSLAIDEPVALLIPYGIYWSEVTPECLVGLDINNSSVVEGHGQPDMTALSIHLGIYRNRPDVKSIMHTHPRYTTVLSCLEDPTIKMIHQTSVRFSKNVAYDSDYSGLSNEEVNDEADRIGKALGDKSVMVMGNHGLVTTGDNVALAFDATYYFEKAAEVQVLAYQTGKPLSYLSDEVVETTLAGFDDFEHLMHLHLEGLRDMLVKRDPNFIDPKRFNYSDLIKRKN